MATGDQNDMMTRMKAVLPSGWFPDTTPVLDSMLAGTGSVFAAIYSQIGYLTQQTRILTSTGVWLDLAAQDLFGKTLTRRLGEADASFLARIQKEMFRPKATRAAVIRVLTDLLGVAPKVFEPAYTYDTGGYGSGGMTAGSGRAYGLAGGYGSLLLPYQCFVTASRASISPIAGVQGYYTGSGGSGGGYGSGASWAAGSGIGAGGGAIEYASLSWTQGQTGDADMEAAVAAVMPCASIAWMAITSTPQGVAPPGVVTGLAASGVGQTGFNLTWTAPSSGGTVTAYDVLLRVTGSGTFAVQATVAGASYSATGLVSGTSYDVAVYAKNSAGPGGLSAILTTATLGAVPNNLASVSAAAGSPA